MSGRIATIIAAMTVLGAAPAAAQSCLAQPLSRGQKNVAMILGQNSSWAGAYGKRDAKGNGEEEYLDIGYTPSPVAGQPGLGTMRFSYAAPFRNESEMAARAASPTASRGFVPCGVLESTAMFVDDYSAYTIAIGGGYAVGTDVSSAYATPIIGWGNEGIGMFINARLGSAYRKGPWYAAAELTVPLNAENAESAFALRLGYTWGQAIPFTGTPTATPATPARGALIGSMAATAAQQGASQGTQAPPAQPTATAPAPVQSAPASTPTGPVAGAKPYSADDIAAMVGNNLTTQRILDLTRRSCVNFRMNDALETRFRRAGAEPELLDGLRKTCFSAQ